MSLFRTIICNVPRCEKTYTERLPGEGFPGWGSIQGKIDDATGAIDFYLCPDCLNKVFDFMLQKEK